MTSAARYQLIRIEIRVGQMYGEMLTQVENTRLRQQPLSLEDGIWLIGLMRTWTQVRKLLETGHLVKFQDRDEPQAA